MGKESDELAVADREFKVRGVKGLRVEGCGSCGCAVDGELSHAVHLLLDSKSKAPSLGIETDRYF